MTKKKDKKGGKRMKKKELTELLVSYFRNKPGEAFTVKQLFQGLKLTTHPLKMLCRDIVEEMTEDNFLVEVEKGRFRLNDKGTGNGGNIPTQKQWKKFIRPRRWRRTDFYCRTQFGSCDEQR